MKNGRQKRNLNFIIRVNNQEKELFNQASKKEGYNSVGTYVRDLVIGRKKFLDRLFKGECSLQERHDFILSRPLSYNSDLNNNEKDLFITKPFLRLLGFKEKDNNYCKRNIVISITYWGFFVEIKNKKQSIVTKLELIKILEEWQKEADQKVKG